MRLSWLPLALALAAMPGCGPRLEQPTRIVIVTFDTTRADRIGCYGAAGAETPAIDALAADGALFEFAVSPVPTTLPSHATLFTGLYPHDHGVRYNLFYRLNDSVTTLAESLQDAGWATAAFPASQIVAERFGLNQGFDHWAEPPRPDLAKGAPHPDSAMRRAGEGVDLALEWLGQHPDDRSFVWLHFYDPHWPYTPPFPFSSGFADRPYEGEIAYADAQLARLMDALRADGRWDRTLVVVTADHGEGLYDHGERYHSTLIYESTQHIPLIIRAPGGTPGRIREPVTLADVMPTVLDLVGLETPAATRGISLAMALKGREPPRRDLYFEALTGAISYGWAELRGIRWGPWKLIDSVAPELYQLEEDPHEQDNLADLEPDRLTELRRVLDEIAEPVGVTGSAEATLELDAETLSQLASLGYVAGTTSQSRREDAPHPRKFTDLEPEMLAAQAALAAQDYSRVVEVCRYVLSRDPTNLWALNSLTSALVGLDRPSEALEPARELLKLNPDSVRAHGTLAVAQRAAGDARAALETLRRGLRDLPDSEQLQYLEQVAAFDAEDPSVCQASMIAVIERYPESARFLVLQARCEARSGDVAAAVDTLERAVASGFSQLDLLETTPDFDGVRANPRYPDLVAAAAAE